VHALIALYYCFDQLDAGISRVALGGPAG
jgi:hypothetical protein